MKKITVEEEEMKPKNIKKLMILILILVVTSAVAATIVTKKNTENKNENKYEEFSLFTSVLNKVQKDYVEPVSTQKLIYGALKGMVNSLDPHSAFMTPNEYRDMQVSTSGEFGGVGMTITMKDGWLTVVSPIEDTPAAKAGIKSGDRVVMIDGKFTREMTLEQSLNMIRGPIGTKVTLTIMREGFKQPRNFVLTREIIKIKSVKYAVLDNNYGYIRILQFQETTNNELEKALKAIHEKTNNNVRGLIIDLRNNPGGLLNQAVDVASRFVKSGLIVYTKGRLPDQQIQFKEDGKDVEPDYPIVVLINGGTASASEIVAGALQDHRRAIIVGTPSFGKGSVQTIIPLDDGSALRLTTALYYTPNGKSIQAEGIQPDITMHEEKIVGVESTNIFAIREKDLEGHFPATETLQKTENNKETNYEQELFKDNEIKRALDILQGIYMFGKVTQAKE
ncbi:MAG: S41 family peptidase [Deltaproteobacteria bacterium]|nr:S41 family peptidase [Deltaproteobacteria bacterium]